MLVYDLDGNEFDKDAVDVYECVKQMNWTTEKPEVKQQTRKKTVKPKAVKSVVKETEKPEVKQESVI